MKRFLIIAFSLAIAACGLREPLQPPPGQAAPAVPVMAGEPLTTEEMLAAPPIARPERVDELLRRSEERPDDRFDLPPGDVPVPADSSSDDDDPE